MSFYSNSDRANPTKGDVCIYSDDFVEAGPWMYCRNGKWVSVNGTPILGEMPDNGVMRLVFDGSTRKVVTE